jgi:hypothetical protein
MMMMMMDEEQKLPVRKLISNLADAGGASVAARIAKLKSVYDV